VEQIEKWEDYEDYDSYDDYDDYDDYDSYDDYDKFDECEAYGILWIIKKKKGSVMRTVSFEVDKTNLEELFGREPIPSTQMTKILVGLHKIQKDRR
jgi:hypothetical protein